MNKERIGENAGIVWRVLHNNRCSWEELVKATELNPLRQPRRRVFRKTG